MPKNSRFKGTPKSANHGGPRQGAGLQLSIKSEDGTLCGYRGLPNTEKNAKNQEYKNNTVEFPAPKTQEEQEEERVSRRAKRSMLMTQAPGRKDLAEEEPANLIETSQDQDSSEEGEDFQRGENEPEEQDGDNLANLDEAPEVEEGGGGNLDLEANLDENQGPGDHLAEAGFGIKFYHAFNNLLSHERTAEMTALVKQRSNKYNSNIKPKLAVAYTKATENHFKVVNDEWECPDRTIDIMKALETAGIFDEATLLDEERMASKEDFLRAHSQDLWDKLQKYKKEAEKFKEKTPKQILASKTSKDLKKKSLYLNEMTVDAALLGAGSVINCVDFVSANGGVAFALPRPGKSPNLIGLTLNGQ